MPVAPDEARAAERLGMSCIGQGFEIALRACRPTIGRELRFDDRSGVESRALSSVAGGAGGFTVPSGFVRSLEVALKSFGPMFQTSEILMTEHGYETLWPTLDDTANEGVQLGENTVADDSDLTFGALVMRAYKFSSGLVKAPHELLRDNAIAPWQARSAALAAIGEGRQQQGDNRQRGGNLDGHRHRQRTRQNHGECHGNHFR